MGAELQTEMLADSKRKADLAFSEIMKAKSDFSAALGRALVALKEIKQNIEAIERS